jgi:RimJ/RimL family protein N-acetyltransferase
VSEATGIDGIEAPRVETERLVLTWPDAVQIDGYYQRIVGTSMFDTLLWDGPDGPQDLHDFWAARREDAAAGSALLSVALITRSDGACIGGASLRPQGDERVFDIGYALAPSHHGRGYGSEAVRAVVDEGFAHRGAERIFATVFVGNGASRRVAEKAGMRLEGTLRRAVCKRGVWRDEWLLAVTRPDWEARR